MACLPEAFRPYGVLLGISAGIVSGVLTGLALRSMHLSPETVEIIGFPGELYVRALQLMILPSIVFSLIAASTNLNIKCFGKMAFRTFGFFIMTSLFSSMLGIVLTSLVHPVGSIYDRYNDEERHVRSSNGPMTDSVLDNILDMLRNIIPNNVLTPFFETTQTKYGPRKSLVSRDSTNLLGVIFLALVCGITLGTFGYEAKLLLDLVKMSDKVFSKIRDVILWIAPVGIFSIICSKIIGPDMNVVVNELGLFVVTIIIGVGLYQFVFLQFVYFLITKKNPFAFYLNVLPASLTGFALTSSSATLPITLKCMDENVKMDPRISRFVIPLGISINMDGSALFVTAATVFIAQLNGVALSFGHHVTLCLTGTVASLLPGSTIVSLLLSLHKLGLPADHIAYLIPVDWFLDHFRTSSNVLGNCYAAAFVEHLSKAELPQIDTEADNDRKEAPPGEFKYTYTPLASSEKDGSLQP